MKVLLAAVQRAAAADYATVLTMLALLLHRPTHVARSLVNGMRLRPDLSAKTNTSTTTVDLALPRAKVPTD